MLQMMRTVESCWQLDMPLLFVELSLRFYLASKDSNVRHFSNTSTISELAEDDGANRCLLRLPGSTRGAQSVAVLYRSGYQCGFGMANLNAMHARFRLTVET